MPTQKKKLNMAAARNHMAIEDVGGKTSTAFPFLRWCSQLVDEQKVNNKRERTFQSPGRAFLFLIYYTFVVPILLISLHRKVPYIARGFTSLTSV